MGNICCSGIFLTGLIFCSMDEMVPVRPIEHKDDNAHNDDRV